MKKINLHRHIALLLAVVLVLTCVLSGCGKAQDPYTSDHTVSVLSTAIRTLSDSAFTDYELIKFIYTHAFSVSSCVTTVLPKDLAETLPTLFGNAPDVSLIQSTVAYGGTTVGDATIGELKPSSTLDQAQLYVGDLLFVSKGTENAYYIYDKDGLVNLSAPLKKVDTAAVLAALSESERFAVLRLMLNMTTHDFVTETQSEKDFTEEQKALVATAQSFLLRGDKVQYVSFKNAASSAYIGIKSPEDHTTDNYGPMQCSGFAYEVYYQALGMEIKYQDEKLITAENMRKYAPELKIRKYLMTCQKSAEYTEEDKERITNEILDLLEPGDILIVDSSSGGHVMLYVGNGNIIHADGSSYNTATYTETYEATVRQRRFKDYFCVEGAYGYLFGSDVGKKVTELCVVRPLDIFEGEIPEVTKNRMKNLSGVMAQKLSSHNISLTADVGEEITYTFEIYNQNDHEVTLAVSDVVPAKSEYVRGAEKVDGDALSWQVTIPANTRQNVSYVVKVAADAKAGDEIVSESGLVGGVPVNCLSVTVGNALSAAERETLKSIIATYKPSEGANGFAMVNDIYKQAFGWEPVFTHTDFEEMYQGEDGLFGYETEWVNDVMQFWLAVQEDSPYSGMVAPRLLGGFGTEEGVKRGPIVMPPKEQQLVVGDIFVAKSLNKQGLYLYAGDGVFYDLLNGYAVDDRTVQGRIEYFLNTNMAYVVLRPSLVH